MRPIRLTIEGLNSFRQKQEIDFEALCRDGLFGIFGPTGSGKSTILDAITLSLYGAVVRARSNTQGICNSQSDRVAVTFTFRMGDTTYRTERTYVRTKGDRDAVRSKEALLYRIEKDDGKDTLLADKPTDVNRRMAEILPLSLEEFTRSVVLPQGQFAGFLTMDKADRRRMLEKIFALGRYGETLASNVKAEGAALQSADDVLQARLQELADATGEALAQLREQAKAARSEAAEAQGHLQTSLARLAEAEGLWRLQQEKDSAENTLRICAQEAPRMAEKQACLTADAHAQRLTEEIRAAQTLARERAEAEQSQKMAQAAHDEACRALERAQREKLAAADGRQEKDEADAQRLAELAAALEMKKTLMALEKDLQAKLAEYRRAALSVQTQEKRAEELRGMLAGVRERKNAADSEKNAYLAYLSKQRQWQKAEYIQALAAALHDGEPCPVCGSREHPVPSAGCTLSERPQEDGNIGEERRAELDELILQCETQLETLEKQLQEAQMRYTDAKTELARIMEEGKALRQQTEELSSKLSAVKTRGDIQADIDAIRQARAERDRRITQTETVFTKAQADLQACAAEKARADGAYAQVKAHAAQAEAALEEKLASAGFASREEAAAALLAGEDVREKLREELTRYEEKRAAALLRVQELTEALDGKSIDAAQTERLRLEKEEAQRAHEAALSREAVAAAAIEPLSEKVARRETLLKESEKLAAQREKHRELTALLRGNALVEYVAQQYMESIAYSATVRLQTLTNRRYALLLENGEFLIEDRYNGGLCRPAASLSGGETFLVSLALAVSLSEHIMQKTPTPLEFFFLDEGFGTLDANLLETVLDALEVLRNDAFSIGVISHLPQLRQRMDRFLLVEGATVDGDGTRVTQVGA